MSGRLAQAYNGSEWADAGRAPNPPLGHDTPAG